MSKAMPQAVYTALKEKLADTKISVDGRDVSLFDEITGDEGWFQKAAHAVEIQTANKDLIKQRDEWEKREREHKEQLTRFETETAELKKGNLSPEERKEYETLKKKGMNSNMEAEFNALKKSVTDLTASIAEKDKLAAQKEIAMRDANVNSAKQALNNKLLTELGKHNIKGVQAEAALSLITQKGYARVELDGDGKINELYRTFDGGKELSSDLSSMASVFAKDNPYLVTGTTNGGTGDEHRQTGARIPQGREMTAREKMASAEKGYDKAI